MVTITQGDGILVASNDVIFTPSGGLFGNEGIDWNVFLGIGGKAPVKTPINLGGALEVSFFGSDLELFRLQLRGEMATRLGLDVNLQVSPGATRATMPYDISYSYPDAQTLIANPFFRLEGDAAFLDGPDAGFETDWPFLLFTVDAVAELAVLVNLTAGILGNNKTFNLLDFDTGARIPLLNIDTRLNDPTDTLLEATPELFGLPLDIILEVTDLTDYAIRNGSSITAKFFTNKVGLELDNSLAVDLEPSEPRNRTDEKDQDTADKVKEGDGDRTGNQRDDRSDDTKNDTTDTSDTSKKGTLKDALSFSAGALAELKLQIPVIELKETGDAGVVRTNIFDPVTYTDGTRVGDNPDNDTDGRLVLNDIVELTLDLDDILVATLKTLAGIPPAGTLGLEGTISLSADVGGTFGPFKASIPAAELFLDYNLFDADLVAGLPINQTIDVTTEPLETRLSFFEADTNGTPIETDGVREATFVTARLPRYSIYFNEANTFWDPVIAQDLLDAQSAANAESDRVAEDLDLFVDFENGRIPGAFTGQTGSISGGFVKSTNGGATWEKLTTSPEETEFLARTRPGIGKDPQLDEIAPADGAIFKYVIYTDGSDPGADGTVDLSSSAVFRHRDVDFSNLVGFDGVFEARLDVVTAPLTSTGLLQGVPSIDLYYPNIAGQSIYVDVAHRASATVANDTSLDFELDIVLSALELNLGAWINIFGARLGFEIGAGPLWEQTFPILKAELAKLYDDSFLIEGTTFTDGTVDGGGALIEYDSWGFAIGATGTPSSLVSQGTSGDDLIDAAAVNPDTTIAGGSGNDTLTFERVDASPDANGDDPSAELTIDLATGRVRIPKNTPTSVSTTAFTNIENVTGTRVDDTISGNSGANILDGGEGDDFIDGRGGADQIFGRVGNDVLVAGGAGSGRDRLVGGEGDDRLIAGAGRAILDGSEDAPVGTSGGVPADLDLVDYSNAPGAITYNVATGAKSGGWIADHTLLNIEGIVGTDFDDIFTGDSGRSYFEGGAGNDLLIGDAFGSGLSRADRLALDGGNDRLYGQDGDDTLVGGPGADMLDGGFGNDTVDYINAPTSVFVDMAEGQQLNPELYAPLLVGTGSDPVDFWRIDGQSWRGWAQGDKLRDIENIRATVYDDIVFGDHKDNVLSGGDGDDRIAGRRGNDLVLLGNGDDIGWAEAEVQGRYQPGSNTPNRADLTLLSPAKGGDVDVYGGGAGDDIAILSRTENLSVIQDNVLVRKFGGGSGSVTENWQIEYRVTPSDMRIVGSLADQTARLEIGAETFESTIGGPEDGLFVDSYSRFGGPFLQAFSNRDAATFFAATEVGESDFDNLYGITVEPGSYFRHSPNDLVIPEDTSILFAELRGMEGMIGSTFGDLLIGTGGANRIYGGGGPDHVLAQGGNDVVSFGEGQPPEQIFSFPGRGFSGISPFTQPVTEWNAASAVTQTRNDSTGATVDNQVVQGDFAIASSNSGGSWLWSGFNNGSTSDNIGLRIEDVAFDFDWQEATDRRVEIAIDTEERQYIATYLSDGSRNRNDIDTLKTNLVSEDSKYADWSLVDGGAGDGDTLDLRYDRGLSFLPRPGQLPAQISLAEGVGRLGYAYTVYWSYGSPQSDDEEFAVIMDVENVIGTGLRDRIQGDRNDNVIEGGGSGDLMDGGAGVDVLSYANAETPVTLQLFETDADGATGLKQIFFTDFGNGDAAGDLFEGFEVVSGSQWGDALSYGRSTSTTAISGLPNVTNNDFQIIDGGGGDDLFRAGLAGGTFLGGEGDDRTLLSIPQFVTVDGGTVTVDGGPGQDQATVSTAYLDSIAQIEGGYRVTQSEGDRTSAADLFNVEYIRFDDTTRDWIYLENEDPNLGTVKDLVIDEDPWSARVLFPGGLFGLPSDRAGTVTDISFGGTFRIGDRVIEVGDPLGPGQIEALRFTPNQNFGVPLDPDDPEGFLTGAVIELTFTQSDGSLQPRKISLGAPDFDGHDLGLSTPTDTEAPGISYEFGKAYWDEEIYSDTVHLGVAPGLDTLEEILPKTRNDAAQGYRLTDVAEGGTVWVTDVTPADATSTDYDLVRQVFVGDTVTQAELELLAFRRPDGSVQEDDFVTLTAVESLDVEIIRIPDRGTVFSPVTALGLTSPLAKTDVSFTLDQGPFDGTLFYRDAGGDRVVVEQGDVLTADLLPRLHFLANETRNATITTDGELAAEIALVNTPTTSDEGEAGQGATALPPDPTSATLQLIADVALPEIDGVAVDLAASETDIALAIDLRNYGYSGGDIHEIWSQWTLEEGGNGHFYTWIPRVGSNSSFDAITTFLTNVNAGLGITAPREGGWYTELASVASAAENDFIFDLFADDPAGYQQGSTNAIQSGPRIGGVHDGSGNWRWLDGTPWELTFWRAGEPNGGATETTLHYLMSRTDGDGNLYTTTIPAGAEIYDLPTWNDVPTANNYAGFVLEVGALATNLNDEIIGSEAADRIEAGGGDDIVKGLDGDDTLRGDAGNDRISGGAGDDTLFGGSGADIFEMSSDGGYDVVADFAAGNDRFGIGNLDLLAIGEVRISETAGGTEIHAGGNTLLLQGFFQGAAGYTLSADDFVGGPVYAGAVLPDIFERALKTGDVIALDEVRDLRYRAPLDFTGDAGRFVYEVRDPWALEDDDPRPDSQDGKARGRVDIVLDPLNDAPRSSDRTYVASAGGVLIGEHPEMRLLGMDPEDDPVVFQLLDGPLNGTVDLQENGRFRYTPNDGFVGANDELNDDRFAFLATDGADQNRYEVLLEVRDTSEVRRAEPGTELDEDGYLPLLGLTTDDTLEGHDGKDRIEGGFGTDIIRGLGGDDILSGGGDDDQVFGDDGDDEIYGGAGDDELYGGSGNDDIWGGPGNDVIEGGDGDDEIVDAFGNNSVRGGEGNDTLRFLTGVNSGFGEGGDDILIGGTGADRLNGGRDNDILIGDAFDTSFAGNDTLTAGTGTDLLDGRGGADVFVFAPGQGDNTIAALDNSGAILGAGFDPGIDAVQLEGFEFGSRGAVLDALSVEDGDAVLIAEGTTIRFEGLSPNDLGADDFLLS